MPPIADLYAAVKADMSEFDSDLQKGLTRSADRSAQTFGQRFKRQLTASNIGAGIGAALGGIGVAALRMGDDYDKAMDTIRIGTGATGDALSGLEADFKAVASQVPDDIGTVSQVIADLNTRTGQTGEGLQTLAEQILDLSRITRTDAASNVANLTRLYGDWSIATEDQAEANDKLFRASQATGIGIDTLAQQMVQFGAPLRNIGYAFEDGISLLAKWEKEGVNTTLALGGLKIALGEFAKEGTDAKEGLADLVDQIVNADTAAQAMALGVDKFGSRAGPDMVAAIREGRFAFDDLVDVVNNGSDTIATATEDTEGLGEAWRQFKNVVATTVGPITKDLGGIANEMGNLIFLLPALGGLLGKGVGAAVGKALPSIRAAGQAAGVAFAGAAGAGGMIGAITAAVAAMAPLAVPVVAYVALTDIRDKANADFFNIADSEELAREIHRLDDERLSIANELNARYGEQGDEVDALRSRFDELNATIPELVARWREMAGVSEDVGEDTGKAFADGVTRGMGSASLPIIPSLKAAAAQVAAIVASAPAWRLLDQALADLAVGGLKDIRASARTTDQTWKRLIETGDRNKKAVKELNEEIGKWERRYERAVRNNDSEAAAYASKQLTRLTGERDQRQEVIDKVQAQHDALDDLPKKTTTTVRANVQDAELDALITKLAALPSNFTMNLKAALGFGPDRAAGGPVSAHVPHVVGERGLEVFVPKTAGDIIPNDALGGDTYNITPNIYGLPQQARTPRETVAELRRTARMGLAIARPNRGFEPV